MKFKFSFVFLTLLLSPLILIGCSRPDATPTASVLIEYEFRYSLPEATEVTLVWGINDWQPVYLEGLPAGTQVKNGVMHTPMTKEGDAFVTRIPFSPGTTVNYGFLAGKATDEAEMVWDGKEEDSFITSQKSEVIEVVSTLELPASQGAGSETETGLITQEFFYRLPQAGEVFLVWGVDGWNVVPEELRPPGTVVTDNLMQTPMLPENGVFIAKIQIPPGVKLDYGFLITKTSSGAITHVWETNESQPGPLIVTRSGKIEVESKIKRSELNGNSGLIAILPSILLWVGTTVTVLIATKLLPEDLYPRSVIWLLVLILGLGLILRIDSAVVWNSYRPDSPERLVGDEPGFDYMARELLRGLGFTWPGRVPLYPIWLALIYLLSGGSYQAVPYFQILLGLATIYLTFILGRRIFNTTAGLIGAAWVAMSYVSISSGLHLLSEALYAPVLLMTLLTFWDALHDPTPKRFIWAGAWLGVSNLVRPTLLLFPMFIAVLMFSLVSKREAFRYGLIYLASSVVIITPWLIHNTIRYKAFFPLQTSNAILWQGSPEYYHLIKDQGYSYQQIWSEILYGPGWRELDPNSVEGDRYWTRRALQSIAAEPVLYLRFATEKIFTFWLGDPEADWGGMSIFSLQGLRKIGFTYRDAIQVMIARMIPIFALIGLIVVRQNGGAPKWRALIPVLALLLYFTIVHALTHAEARLSEPLQPFLLIILAGAVVTLTDKLGRRSLPVSETSQVERAQ